MKPGSLFIDHTTVSARIARQLFVEGESRGIFFVYAPVSGGQAGAEKGTLSIMGGGADEPGAAASLVIQSPAGQSVAVGGAGAGPATTTDNTRAIAGVVPGLSEAFGFGRGAEPDSGQGLEGTRGRRGPAG